MKTTISTEFDAMEVAYVNWWTPLLQETLHLYNCITSAKMKEVMVNNIIATVHYVYILVHAENSSTYDQEYHTR